MSNPWKQWQKQLYDGLLLYTVGDRIEALAIMRIIHPRMDLGWAEDDADILTTAEHRALELMRGKPDNGTAKPSSDH